MNRKRDQAYRGKITSSPLDNLFGEEPEARIPNSVALESIQLPGQQPRRYFDPEKMEQLSQSVKQHGILEPLVVRPLADGEYELVAGERRYRAAQAVGLSEVPVTIRELSDNEALELSLVENLQREDLNPVEETEGILHLIALKLDKSPAEVTALLYRMTNEVKGNINRNVTVSWEEEAVKKIFASIGTMKWESFVRNRLSLLKLSEELLLALQKGQIAYTKAQVIARLKEKKQRQRLLEQAIRDNLSLTEIRERVKNLQPVPEPQSPKKMFKSISSRLNKSKNLWTNPEKLEKLKLLLKQMEELIEE